MKGDMEVRTDISQRVIDVVKVNLDKQNSYGFKKYNETLDDVEFEEYDWNDMAMQELIDCSQYLMKENLRLRMRLAEYEKQHGKGSNDVNFKIFQEDVRRTMPSIALNIEDMLAKSNFGLGLNGEAGEFTEIVKKNVHDGHTFDREKFVEEGGDVLYYLVGLADLYDVSFEELATMNMFKRMKRYPNGYSKKMSVKREDVGYTSTFQDDMNGMYKVDKKI